MPTRPYIVTIVACVLVAAAGCGSAGSALSPSAPVPSGLTFTIRTTGTSFGGEPLNAQAIPTRFRAGLLRFDFPTRHDPSGRHRPTREFYLLVNMGAKTTTVVMPESKLYWETRFDSAASRGSRPAIVRDVDVSGESIGSGEIVNGYATRHYRVTTRYTETAPDTRKKRDARKTVHVIEDIWVADSFEDVGDPMQAYLRVVRSGSRNESVETLDQVADRQANARRKLFSGLPLRTTWLYSQAFDGGGNASRTLTVDLLDLERADLDPGTFRAPDDYRRFDLGAAIKAAGLLLSGGYDTTKARAAGRQRP